MFLRMDDFNFDDEFDFDSSMGDDDVSKKKRKKLSKKYESLSCLSLLFWKKKQKIFKKMRKISSKVWICLFIFKKYLGK